MMDRSTIFASCSIWFLVASLSPPTTSVFFSPHRDFGVLLTFSTLQTLATFSSSLQRLASTISASLPTRTPSIHREKTRQIQKRFITRFVHTNHALNHIGLNRLPDDKSFVNPIMNPYLILYLINTQNH